jgi:CARDB
MIPIQYWTPANYIARDHFGNTFSATNPSRGIHEQTAVVTNPDLVITDIEVVGAAELGSPVTIQVTVQNTGTGAVSAPLDLFLNPATQPPTTASTPTQTQTVSLAAGGSQVVTFTLTLTQAGNNTLYAWIDRINAVVESNETNNLYGPTDFVVEDACSGSIADFDCDGDVDIVDYTFLTARFYKTTPDDLRADIASRQGVGIPDGRVDLFDYTVLVDEFSL